MKFQEENTEIPDWILRHLRRFGNCCCGRDIVKKYGKDEFLELLRKEGYPCILKIVYENKYKMHGRRVKYPVDAYYILEIECVVKSYFICEE